MKIAAVCCTFLRPRSLGQLIRCFELQDYPPDRRELVVLDDAGQYEPCRGEGWRVVSTGKRFATLGAKRNAAAALVSPDVEALAVFDDDDLYLPWALRASAAALAEADWSRPGAVLHREPDGSLAPHATGGLYHGGWAYRRAAFLRAGGYPEMNNGEDQALARRLERLGVCQADPLALGFRPFYVYTWGGGWHLSNLGADGYRRLGGLYGEKTRIPVADPPWLDLLAPRILPGLRPRKF